jgi:hypothetical protein
VLDGLGAMGVAQMQQRMVAAVPPVAKDIWFDWDTSMMITMNAGATIPAVLFVLYAVGRK